MAVALRELEHRRTRRPSLRVIDPGPFAPTPRRVYWMRRLIVMVVLATLVCGGVLVTRALTDDGLSAAARFEMTVVMPPGGTLWDLAEMYAPDQDRAAWVTEVAERNGVDPGAIRPGTPLTVSVETPTVTAEVDHTATRAPTTGH